MPQKTFKTEQGRAIYLLSYEAAQEIYDLSNIKQEIQDELQKDNTISNIMSFTNSTFTFEGDERYPTFLIYSLILVRIREKYANFRFTYCIGQIAKVQGLSFAFYDDNVEE